MADGFAAFETGLERTAQTPCPCKTVAKPLEWIVLYV